MLQPSCFFTPEWKIPMGGKSYFYIRFTCNGFIPILGKEQIMVKYGPNELVSSSVCISSVLDPDLVGPFEKISIKGQLPEDIPEAYAYINFQTIFQSSPLRNVRTLFSFWNDVGIEGLWEKACLLQLKDGTCHNPIPGGYKYFHQVFTSSKPASLECNLFVRQVIWKKCVVNLYELEPTTEIIDGKSYPVYKINFAGLYLLKRLFYQKSPDLVNLSFIERLISSSYVTYANDTDDISVDCLDQYQWPDPECEDIECVDYIRCLSITPGLIKAQSLSASQFIILSDLFGLNTQFVLLEISEMYYIFEGEFLLVNCDWEKVSTLSNLDDTEILNYVRYTYEKSLTPSNYF